MKVVTSQQLTNQTSTSLIWAMPVERQHTVTADGLNQQPKEGVSKCVEQLARA